MTDALKDGQKTVSFLKLEDRFNELLILSDDHFVPGSEPLVILNVHSWIVHQQRLSCLQIASSQSQVESCSSKVILAIDAWLYMKKGYCRNMYKTVFGTLGLALMALCIN